MRVSPDGQARQRTDRDQDGQCAGHKPLRGRPLGHGIKARLEAQGLVNDGG